MKVATLVQSGITAFVFSAALQGADFCALQINVRGPGNIPLAVPIELVSASGKITRTIASRNGLAEFCDFDFGEYKIVVGSESCGRTTIEHVRLCYGNTQKFDVILNRCACSQRTLLQCLAYFRVSDVRGRPLSNVSVSMKAGAGQKTDEFGRVQVALEPGGSGTVQFALTGFEVTEVPLTCANPGEMERRVVLKEAGGR